MTVPGHIWRSLARLFVAPALARQPRRGSPRRRCLLVVVADLAHFGAQRGLDVADDGVSFPQRSRLPTCQSPHWRSRCARCKQNITFACPACRYVPWPSSASPPAPRSARACPSWDLMPAQQIVSCLPTGTCPVHDSLHSAGEARSGSIGFVCCGVVEAESEAGPRPRPCDAPVRHAGHLRELHYLSARGMHPAFAARGRLSLIARRLEGA